MSTCQNMKRHKYNQSNYIKNLRMLSKNDNHVDHLLIVYK
jgi:hypothetical protein